MPLTAEQWQTLILAEVGDDGSVRPQIATLWVKNEIRTSIFLQYLYTKRDAVGILKGNVWEDTNVRMLTRSGIDVGAKYDHLAELYKSITAEIDSYAESGDSPVVADMDTLTPEPGISGFRDPNDPRFRGDPLAIQLGRIF